MKDDDPEIVLSWREMLIAAHEGVLRRITGLKGEYEQVDGNVSSWTEDIESAMSEFALSKHLDRHWTIKANSHDGDVGEEEARQTEYSEGHLIIRPKDFEKANAGEARFWLLTGRNGRYKVRGWIYGKDAKRPVYWGALGQGRPPAWNVPQEDLQKEMP
jgi:hypothetical protein